MKITFYLRPEKVEDFKKGEVVFFYYQYGGAEALLKVEADIKEVTFIRKGCEEKTTYIPLKNPT